LHEGAETCIEPQSPSFGITQKLALKRQLGLASISSVADEVVEVEGDRPDDPGEHDAIKAQPRGGLGCDRGINEDVVAEDIAAEGEEDQVPPTGIGGGLGLEDDRDKQPDVLNTPGLVVKLRNQWIGQIVSDDRGGGRAVTRRAGGGGPNVVVGGRDEELLRLGDLAGQCIGGIPLALPSESSRTDTGLSLCGRCPGRDERGGEGGVGGARRGTWAAVAARGTERRPGPAPHPRPELQWRRR
jgi:hypothetical protein